MISQNQMIAASQLFRLANSAAPVAALFGIGTFIGIAILGYAKDAAVWMWDFDWYYAGGYCFRIGSDMYDLDCFGPELERLNGFEAVAGLAYPPHFGIIARSIATLPYDVSARLFFGITVVFALAMVALTIRIEKDRWQGQKRELPLSHLWAIALVLGSSGIWGSIWLGQITLLLALCAWLAFSHLEQKNDAIAGILLALLSIKPQLAALVFLWVLLQERFRALLWAALVAGLMSIYIFAQMGMMPAIEGWLNGMSTYQQYPVNRLGDGSVMGLPSLLALFGINLPVFAAMVIAALLLLAIRLWGRMAPFSPLALATILSVQMLVFSRPVDMFLIAPAFALIWPTVRSRPRNVFLFFVAVAAFCMPQRPIADAIPFPMVAHFRTFLLFALAGVFIHQAWQGKASEEHAAKKRP